MKLYVPEIGDYLQLTADWTFNLYNEHRNKSVWDLYDCDSDPIVQKQKSENDHIHDQIRKIEAKLYPRGYYQSRVNPDLTLLAERTKLSSQLQRLFVSTVTIPKESVLAVDRIYIRKGMDEWSSLTFYLKYHPNKQFKKKPRFWAKLSDCNHIEFIQHSS